jgi:hypothetical protein
MPLPMWFPESRFTSTSGKRYLSGIVDIFILRITLIGTLSMERH